MPPSKNPDEARAQDIAQKSESMARELSQKREMRIRQDRVRHLSSDDSASGSARARSKSSSSQALADDKTVRAEDVREPPRSQRPTSAQQSVPFYPERRPSMLDEVATELEELLRDLRSGFRRWALSDKITFVAALATFAGVLMPWVSDKNHAFLLGITSGGSLHAALACAAIALLVGRGRSGKERSSSARRASLWHLLIGFLSTGLCAYFLVIYGLQRSATTGLEIRYGLYVTLAAGMGLSYGGFARFWSRHQ